MDATTARCAAKFAIFRRRTEALSAKPRFRIDRNSGRPFLDQVRDQLINFIHFGTVKSGTRLPAVRELAHDTGVNLKTAFKIYQALAREGFVVIRPQSGVFVHSTNSDAERAYRRSVTQFISRVAAEAQKLNLTPQRLAHLLTVKDGDRRPAEISCAVLECNAEQTHLFAREIERLLHVRVHPMELQHGTLPRRDLDTLRRVDFLVTTDFHWDEVARLAERWHKKVFKIALDPAFLNMVLKAARRGPVAMILTETSFEPRFREAISAYLAPAELDRIRLVHAGDRAAVAAAARECDAIYVSPLCEAKVLPRLKGKRLLRCEQMLSEESLHELKENLNFYPLL